jgi:23S rRNA pseudouridine2605 synthase
MGVDNISVDGQQIVTEAKIYLVMNKPRGLVTTASDEKGRTTVYSVLGESGLPWVAPVGRLDKASEGLLLMTNDSEWGARVAAPESHLDKTYHVQIGCIADQKMLKSMMNGIKLDGHLLRAKSARLIRSGEKHCWLEIVLDKGKNRQIRRMLDALGVEVLRLVRVAIGPLKLGDLRKGSYRPLTAHDKRQIDEELAPRMSGYPAGRNRDAGARRDSSSTLR